MKNSGVNFTRPNDEDYEDKPEDWLKGALAFAAALGHLLKDNEGIVVDCKNDLKELTKCDKIMVYQKNNQINIEELEADLPEGSLIMVHDVDDLSTKKFKNIKPFNKFKND